MRIYSIPVLLMRNRNLACSNISTSNIREQLAILLTYLLTPLILKNSEGKRSGGMDFVLLCIERSDVRNNIHFRINYDDGKYLAGSEDECMVDRW